jgi:hypothetical protein
MINKHFQYYLIFTLLVLTSKSQVESPFYKYHLFGRQLSLNINAQYGSTAINNRMTNKFLFGGNIDQALKDKNKNRLNKVNVLGGFTNIDFEGIIGKDTSKLHYLISFSLQDFYNVRFTKDAYQLLLYGNNSLKGQTADLSLTNYKHLSFQTFTFGVIFNRLKTTSAKIGLGASLFTTDEYVDFKFSKNASLYTAGDATQVVFNNQSQYVTTDPSKKNIYSINGVGTGINFYIDAPYKTKNKRDARIIFTLNNMGFVYLNNKTEDYFGDSTYVFSGQNVNDINELFIQGLSNLNADSIIKSNFAFSKKSRIAIIPASFTLGNYWYFTKKFHASLFVNYVFNSDYRAYVYTEQHWKPNQSFSINSHIGYGGFTKLNIGAGFTYNWKKNLTIAAGSHQLMGILFPDNFGAEGFYCSLVKKLK